MSDSNSDFDLMAFLNRDRSEPLLDDYVPYDLDESRLVERCEAWLRLQREARSEKPLTQRNRIEDFEGGFRILCDYDQTFIETLKAMIPYRERFWEDSTKSWVVTNNEYRDQIEMVFNMFYEWTFIETEIPE